MPCLRYMVYYPLWMLVSTISAISFVVYARANTTLTNSIRFVPLWVCAVTQFTVIGIESPRHLCGGVSVYGPISNV
jgi:hypothetical protein